MQQDNDPKQTAHSTYDFIRGETFNPNEHEFHLLKRKLNGEKAAINQIFFYWISFDVKPSVLILLLSKTFELSETKGSV